MAEPLPHRGHREFPTAGWTNAVSNHEKPDRLRSVEPFTGLRVTVLEGDGKTTVLREVVHYFDEYGNRIAISDPFEEKARAS